MRRWWAVAVAILSAAACGGSEAGGEEVSARPTVLAAASLTEAFEELGGADFSFAGSQSLATQLEQGAPADVIATADERVMQRLVDAGLVEEPAAFAGNELVIAVEPGNPKGVRGLADLGRDDLVVVLADPSVPVGAYAAGVLERAGVTVRPSSLELDVKAVLAKVTSGEADAGIVYATDTDDGVEIPDDQNIVATYPIAVASDAPHPEAARAFVRRVLGERGRDVLRRHGFLDPP